MDKQLLQSSFINNRNRQRKKELKPLTQKKSNNIGIYILVFIILTGITIGFYFGLKKVKDVKETKEARKEYRKEARKKYEEDEEEENTEKEVYSVMKNQWQYDDAKYVCKALNSELATYDQLVEASKNGAHWCNLGWVKTDKTGDDDGLRLAHYPIQRKLFNKQRTNNKSIVKNKCGKVWNNNNKPDFTDTEHAIQGGKYSKYQTLGVNCYGIKRPITDEEKYLLEQKSELDREDLEKLEEIKQKIGDNGLLHNLYTNYKWSRYNEDDDDNINTNLNLNLNLNLTDSNLNLTDSNLNLTDSNLNSNLNNRNTNLTNSN
jgi:hypothetical protein